MARNDVDITPTCDGVNRLKRELLRVQLRRIFNVLAHEAGRMRARYQEQKHPRKSSPTRKSADNTLDKAFLSKSSMSPKRSRSSRLLLFISQSALAYIIMIISFNCTKSAEDGSTITSHADAMSGKGRRGVGGRNRNHNQ